MTSDAELDALVAHWKKHGNAIPADVVTALRQERDAAIANLANLQIAFNDWKVFHSTTRLEVENEQLRALLREANKWIGRDCTSVREQIAELAPLCNRIDAALQEQK